MTGHADLIREAREYRHPKMGDSMPGGLVDWGPTCAFCGNDEYRIDGYCSHECQDLHEHVIYILALADALEAAGKEIERLEGFIESQRAAVSRSVENNVRAEAAEKERDEAQAESGLLRAEIEELDGLRLSCVCYRGLDTPEPPGAESEVIGP